MLQGWGQGKERVCKVFVLQDKSGPAICHPTTRRQLALLSRALESGDEGSFTPVCVLPQLELEKGERSRGADT